MLPVCITLVHHSTSRTGRAGLVEFACAFLALAVPLPRHAERTTGRPIDFGGDAAFDFGSRLEKAGCWPAGKLPQGIVSCDLVVRVDFGVAGHSVD